MLWGASSRLELDGRTLRFRYRAAGVVKPPLGVREEAYPNLWDLEPDAYARVLAAGRLLLVHDFALAADTSATPRTTNSFLGWRGPYRPRSVGR